MAKLVIQLLPRKKLLKMLFPFKAKFTKTPATQTLVSGKPGIISCSAQGAPDPQLEKWSREDGKLLETRRFTQLSNWSLYIDPVKPDDGGKYRCYIKQSKGETSTRKYKAISISVIGESISRNNRRRSKS